MTIQHDNLMHVSIYLERRLVMFASVERIRTYKCTTDSLKGQFIVSGYIRNVAVFESLFCDAVKDIETDTFLDLEATEYV